MTNKKQTWDRKSIEAFNSDHPIGPDEQTSFDRARIRLAQQLGASADDIAAIHSEIHANTTPQSSE
jgi:hypothetical protein